MQPVISTGRSRGSTSSPRAARSRTTNTTAVSSSTATNSTAGSPSTPSPATGSIPTAELSVHDRQPWPWRPPRPHPRDTAMTRKRVERGIYLQTNGTYGVYLLVNGKLTFKTAGRKLSEARRLRNTLQAKADRGELATPTRLTFAQL